MPPNRKSLPAYTPEELLKYGKSFAATFEVPDDVSEDMAAEFAMAALATGEKPSPDAASAATSVRQANVTKNRHADALR